MLQHNRNIVDWDIKLHCHCHNISYSIPGELYLSPIQASVQLKPSFDYLDKVDTRQKAEQESKLAEAG